MKTQLTFIEGYDIAFNTSWEWNRDEIKKLLCKYGAKSWDADENGGVTLELDKQNHNGETSVYLQPGNDANCFLSQLDEIDDNREKKFKRQLLDIYTQQKIQDLTQ